MEETNTNSALLLTGGNIGDTKRYLQQAKKAIETNCGSITMQSSLYQTAAWGQTNQPAFINQCLVVNTKLTAPVLLQTILQIEKELGRERGVRYGPRTIDIDIIFFNNEIINQPGLHIPHPQMQHRRFVLECVNDVAPKMKHPQLHKTIAQLLAECTDPLAVHKIC